MKDLKNDPVVVLPTHYLAHYFAKLNEEDRGEAMVILHKCLNAAYFEGADNALNAINNAIFENQIGDYPRGKSAELLRDCVELLEAKRVKEVRASREGGHDAIVD